MQMKAIGLYHIPSGKIGLAGIVIEPSDKLRAAETDAQKHRVDANVPLGRIVEMLADYQHENEKDVVNIGGLLLTLGIALDNDSSLKGSVYFMRPNAVGKRKISKKAGITEDFKQGPTRLAGGGYSYPGDEFFKSDKDFTLQIHFFDLTEDDVVTVKKAPLIAWHIPRPLAKAWLVQTQPGQKSK